MTDDLGVGLKTARDELALHMLGGGTVVEVKNEKNGVATQGVEDSTPGPQEKEEMPTDGASTVLLCVSGFLNGFSVKFLIDRGASECFVDIAFAKKHGLKPTKMKEKLKILLADGTVCVSSWVVK